MRASYPGEMPGGQLATYGHQQPPADVAAGDLEVEHLSNLSEQEAVELGSTVGALIGLGIDGEEGAEAGAAAGAERAANGDVSPLRGEEWDVLEDIPTTRRPR